MKKHRPDHDAVCFGQPVDGVHSFAESLNYKMVEAVNLGKRRVAQELGVQRPGMLSTLTSLGNRQIDGSKPGAHLPSR